MANLLSPGVYVSEVDLTTIIPSVGTSEGAFVGEFEWGPVNEVRLITNQSRLVATFGRPTNNTYVDFWTASNFLAYGNNLRVVRVVDENANNATDGTTQVRIDSKDAYELGYEDLSAPQTSGMFAARYPGDFGNSLTIAMCTNATTFKSPMSLQANLKAGNTTIQFTKNPGNADATRNIANGDILTFKTAANTLAGFHEAKVVYVSPLNDTIIVDSAPTQNANLAYVEARWEYADRFDDAPGTSDYAATLNGANDEIHMVVVDKDGKFAGQRGRVLEVFPFLSKAVDGRRENGSANYYVNVIKQRSNYVYVINPPDGLSGDWGRSVIGNTFGDGDGKYKVTLTGGSDAVTGSAARVTALQRFFGNKEDFDISLVLTGEADETLVTAVKDLVEGRGDCIAFISPKKADVVNNVGKEALSVVAYRDTLPSSNRLVMDSAWKYQFDKFTNTYRWLPMNGDIAGCCVYTDQLRDAWWSPAGFSRGKIKNCIKISWNPEQGERDELYKKGINPIVTFPAEGTILYGDKTMQTRPSAFDRINVRRLFDVLERSISRAAKYSLFEFNDQFTRAQFVSLVEPYLRDVQGRRGIYDFRVVCDETNNTPEVIDRNEFVGDIYIKPARSINFIRLNFVAVRTGVNFDEITGKF